MTLARRLELAAEYWRVVDATGRAVDGEADGGGGISIASGDSGGSGGSGPDGVDTAQLAGGVGGSSARGIFWLFNAAGNSIYLVVRFIDFKCVDSPLLTLARTDSCDGTRDTRSVHR